MARLRWTLVLFALGIGLPALLIVQRATEALELEKAHRHETVAERVFDEMERTLSDFLLREESRPASDYDHARESVAAPEPLPESFARADEPFILGWFLLSATGPTHILAVEPHGRTQIEGALRAALTPGAVADDGVRSADREREDWMLGADARTPAPGRTRSLLRTGLDEEDLGQKRAQALAEPSPYEVLRNLNRAGSLRSERQNKALAKGSEKRTRAAHVAELERAPASAKDDALRAAAGFDDGAYAASPREPRIDADPASEARDEHEKKSESTTVDPLVGRTTSGGAIVLTRSAWRGTHVDRQGLVLDRARLIEWLGGRILGETGLAERASLDFTPHSSQPEKADYRYLHRFAEPFDGLIARLDLQPLPALAASRSIPTLAILLAVSVVIGLFAVDRMTRVVVEYAQRRSDFVAAVSHELRTPLTAIRMYGEMLRDGLVATEGKRAEYYATITDESERLSRLIDNVLEFSRLEQDRRELDLVVGGLSETVRAASEKLSAHAEREGFELVLDLPAALPRVHYDRDAITQIVFNLVDNALKYARDAERKRIEIQLSPRADGAELRVRDFGPGAPADQLNRIFEPFYRIGEELTRATEGTGIGLALVRELAIAMGGTANAIRPNSGGLEIVVSFASAD
ncbi:MAG: HAMP domain-containing histidine kinase [bacterium]|nr:hypothetical protein [Deltaproteobacteria bacterium]MCP4903862.1 HAMP domain-containing histidine kinase [bacterium]